MIRPEFLSLLLPVSAAFAGPPAPTDAPRRAPDKIGRSASAVRATLRSVTVGTFRLAGQDRAGAFLVRLGVTARAGHLTIDRRVITRRGVQRQRFEAQVERGRLVASLPVRRAGVARLLEHAGRPTRCLRYELTREGKHWAETIRDEQGRVVSLASGVAFALEEPLTSVPLAPRLPRRKTKPKAPTQRPTKAPAKLPTKAPTKAPSKAPTKAPTQLPSKAPTRAPAKLPAKRSPTKAPQRKVDLPLGVPRRP